MFIDVVVLAGIRTVGLMVAFFADYAGGEITPDPSEIEAAGWFALDALPPLPDPVSIARRLIDAAVLTGS